MNIKTLLGILFLAFIAWAAYHRALGADVPPPADWPTHNVSALNCTVRAPWPLSNTGAEGAAEGVTGRGTTRGGSRKIFGIMMMLLPPEARNAEYVDLTAQQNADALKLANLRIESCTINGFKGRLLTGIDKNGRSRNAAYLLVGERIYVVASILPNEPASAAFAEAFLQSFDVPGGSREPEIALGPPPEISSARIQTPPVQESAQAEPLTRPSEPTPPNDGAPPPPIVRTPPSPPPASASPPAPPAPSMEQVLGETTDPQVLLTALKGRNQSERLAALRRLRAIKPPQPDPAVAEELMAAMSHSGLYLNDAGAALPNWLAESQVPAVLQRAQERNSLQRSHERAILLAAAAKFPSPHVNRAIFDVVDDFHVRTRLVTALGDVGEPAEMVGIAACNHRDPEIRRFGVDVLSQVGGQRGLAVLLARSRDPDFHVKSSAKRAADKVRQRLLDRNAR